MNKAVWSGVINGLLITFGAYMAVASALPDDAGFSAISQITWSIIVVTGLVAAGKDFMAYLAQSPTKPNL